MRIVHVETGRHAYGGARQVLALAGGLAAHDVDNILVCVAGSDVQRAAGDAAIPTRPVPMAGDGDARFVLRLRRLLADTRAELVHVHSRRGADWYGGVAAAMAGVPAVLSRRVDRRERRWPALIKYRRYAKVIAISACIAEQLRDVGVAEERLALVRSGVDPDSYVPTWDRARFANEFAAALGAPTVAVVAQLIERKGVRDLVPVVRTVRNACPDLRVVCFGAGPLLGELVHAAEVEGLADVLRFAGFRADLRDYLGCFDALLHPARREGLGLSLLEAQAAGVPVIAYACGGVREAVADRETGLLVPAGDTRALGEALRRVVADRELHGRLSAGARQRIASDFNVQSMINGNLAVYRDVLEQLGDRRL